VDHPPSAAGGARRTLALGVAYEGTAYHGFGIQPGQPTIQEVLEGALARCLGEPIRVTAAGRTDAGVHAAGQVVSFSTGGRIAADRLARALDAHLPEDVQVAWAAEMPDGFDARRSALRRRYRYCIWNRPRPDLWRRRWTWHLPDALDVEAMDRAAATLAGRRDFAAFAGGMAREPRDRTTVRTVERAAWRRDGPVVRFDIAADAFLRHMVRGLVGTLVLVGRGKLERDQFEEIVRAADRRRAGPNAPPRGLTLVGVDYPTEIEALFADRKHESDTDPDGRDGRLEHLSSDAAGVPAAGVPPEARGEGTPRGDGGP
jgi:tRNA pseudouridine38-40 synthase